MRRGASTSYTLFIGYSKIYIIHNIPHGVPKTQFKGFLLRKTNIFKKPRVVYTSH